MARPILGRRALARRAVVHGDSMAPTLREGDVVLLVRSRRVRPGHVVLVRWAQRPGQLSVKRAVRPAPAGWHVLGDNPARSTDSRSLGPAEVLGVIPARLWPRPSRLSGRCRVHR